MSDDILLFAGIIDGGPSTANVAVSLNLILSQVEAGHAIAARPAAFGIISGDSGAVVQPPHNATASLGGTFGLAAFGAPSRLGISLAIAVGLSARFTAIENVTALLPMDVGGTPPVFLGVGIALGGRFGLASVATKVQVAAATIGLLAGESGGLPVPLPSIGLGAMMGFFVAIPALPNFARTLANDHVRVRVLASSR